MFTCDSGLSWSSHSSCYASRKSVGDDSDFCGDLLISVRSPRRWKDLPLPQNTDLYIPLVEKEKFSHRFSLMSIYLNSLVSFLCDFGFFMYLLISLRKFDLILVSIDVDSHCGYLSSLLLFVVFNFYLVIQFFQAIFFNFATLLSFYLHKKRFTLTVELLFHFLLRSCFSFCLILFF